MNGSKGTMMILSVLVVLLIGTECARLGGSGRDTDLSSNIRGRVKSSKFFGSSLGSGPGCIEPGSNEIYPLYSVIQRDSKLCRCVKLDGMMKFDC
ncbi:hypothetical protein ACHWQZ_G003090 [Mnemiopsis leidyi]